MPTLSRAQILGEICAFLTSLLGKPCTPHDDLRAMGVDSITFLELVIFIERRLKVPLPLEIITSQPISTADALTNQLLSLHPQLTSAEA